MTLGEGHNISPERWSGSAPDAQPVRTFRQGGSLDCETATRDSRCKGLDGWNRIHMLNSDVTIPEPKPVRREMDLEMLRRELHAAVDGIVDRWSPPVAEAPTDYEPEIVHGDLFGIWTYRWPDKQEEEFTSGRWYAVREPEQSFMLRLAWTTRRAWGRERGRAIVFQQLGGDGSHTYYPLVEFVETDDPGLFASPIPDPDRPRALLAEGMVLPSRFADAKVERADRVFRSIENGPSVRLIVGHDDEVDMIRHGYWVGRARGRI